MLNYASAWTSSDVKIVLTAISLAVNVPVLSEHITLTQPLNQFQKIWKKILKLRSTMNQNLESPQFEIFK